MGRENIHVSLSICEDRVVKINGDVAHKGPCVLYWMTAARRTNYNLSLQHAIYESLERNLPLIVVEPLSIDHDWACNRFHTFIAQGMTNQRMSFQDSNITYIPYIERKSGDLIKIFDEMLDVCDLVVVDDYPTYIAGDVARRAEFKQNRCETHLVDSNGFIGFRTPGRDFTSAYSLRRHLHKTILNHLSAIPLDETIIYSDKLPKISNAFFEEIREKSGAMNSPFEFMWRIAEGGKTGEQVLQSIDIDHSVKPISNSIGGQFSASKIWSKFLKEKLSEYNLNRNHPDMDATTGLSPWIHFGHISSQMMIKEILEKENWSVENINPPHNGRRSNWWGLSESSEAFLDQMITWRDLGFIHCYNNPEHHCYNSIPAWARTTLEVHENDTRQYLYTLEELENAQTHDELWNCAQRQLKQDGVIQNYLRMLWGKKILEWSPNAEIAFDRMVILNNKWCLDGRDPNSYTGIGWVCGKFDRGWTEREIYGKVRCMKSKNTQRKVKTELYLSKFKAK